MKVRIKKRDLVRDGLSPWSDDCLGRRSLEDCLENLVKNAFDPLVVAVNGTWGSGKSYFLYNWYLDLENHYKDCEGTSPALYFNSWEADYAVDSLLAILGQLYLHFEKIPKALGKGRKERIANRKPIAGDAKVWPALVKQFSNCAKHLTGIDSEEVYADCGRNGIKLLRKFKKQSENRAKLVESLRLLAEYVFQAFKHPLVVIIDELDRCRPTFAVETLERIKHLFSVPHVVFVLGIDRVQLGKTVRAVYGDIDAERYLQRFIDVDFVFPPADTGAFIDKALEDYGIVTFLRGVGTAVQKDMSCFKQVLHSLCQYLGLTLRDIESALKTFAGVMMTYDRKSGLQPFLLVMLILLKVRNQALYDKYAQHAATVNELLDFFIPAHIEPTDASPYLQTIPAVVYASMQHNGDNQPLCDLEQWRFIRGSNANAELSSAHRFISALENGQMTKVIATAHDMIAGTNGLDRVDADVVKSLAERLDCFRL